jgi:general secretion pathway protein N
MIKFLTSKLLWIGIISFMLALLATLPISFVLSYLPKNIPIQLSQVSGTIWQGKAVSVRYQNIEFGQLNWDIQPLSLFLGQLSSHINLNGEQIKLDSDVAIHWDKTLHLSKTQAEIEASFLQNFKKIPAKLAGTFNLNLDSVVVKIPSKQVNDQLPLPLIQGKIEWHNAQVLSPVDIPLGAFRLVLKTRDQTQLGQLNSLDAPNAPIALDTKLQLDQKYDYQVKGKIKANKQANALLKMGINSLGKAKADAYIPIDEKGNLQKLPFLANF